MAYIDTIHLFKDQFPIFYNYLKSIDKEFKEYFPNSSSILKYTYQEDCTQEILNQYDDEQEITVADFPQIVNKWLAHRNDLPEIIKNQLLYQYGQEIFDNPIYEINNEPLSHKFKIIKHTKLDGRKWRKPIDYWAIDIDGIWRWYPSLEKFVQEGFETPDTLGYGYYFGWSNIKLTSLKAVFRFLRKHGFSKGTTLKVFDYYCFASYVKIKFV